MTRLAFTALFFSLIFFGLPPGPARAQGWNLDCSKISAPSKKARCLAARAQREKNIEAVKERRKLRDERQKKFEAKKKAKRR